MVGNALGDVCAAHPAGNWMVRLLLDEDGAVQAQAHPMPGNPQTVRLQLAPRPIPEAHGDFVRHKTTHRAHYDAFTPTAPGVFDTVLWNAEGEVTECTRGNIALLLNGRWVTPAAHCGLLPGIGRAHWLAQGRIEEAVVHVSALPQVQAFAFINSLRGWVPAELVKP